ncbi:MAG: glycosyltransferase, partial [Terricaulis sp.]
MMPSVLAIVCVRNEAVHIERCLTDLINGGCEVRLIDNGSTDGTRELASRFLGNGLLGIDDLPWTGAFSLTDQLAAKNALVASASHDWIIHADAEDSRVTGVEGETLADAIAAADGAGFTVINFHELAFVPLPGEDFERPDYASRMANYYFFQPKYPRLNRAW